MAKLIRPTNNKLTAKPGQHILELKCSVKYLFEKICNKNANTSSKKDPEKAKTDKCITKNGLC